jgi:hypothetical protein
MGALLLQLTSVVNCTAQLLSWSPASAHALAHSDSVSVFAHPAS